MSYKMSMNNSFKSNCDTAHWNKTPSLDVNVKLAGEEAKDRLYEPKHEKKLVRVLTVVAYIFFVSLAAIMLSLYYVFIWNGHLRESTGVKTVIIPIRTGCEDVSDKLTSGINPTVDYEDTTSATQVNLTFFRDLQEFNQSMGNMKRSNVLIRKLIRHHNMMPK